MLGDAPEEAVKQEKPLVQPAVPVPPATKEEPVEEEAPEPEPETSNLYTNDEDHVVIKSVVERVGDAKHESGPTSFNEYHAPL